MLTVAVSLAGDLQKQLDQRTRERDEALEQQKAAAEVLHVIARSRDDLQPVLDAIVQTASRLCEAEMLLYSDCKMGCTT